MESQSYPPIAPHRITNNGGRLTIFDYSMFVILVDDYLCILLFIHAVFFHGEISGASDFDADTLLCRFKVVTDGDNWDLLEGQADGQTQAHTTVVESVAITTLPLLFKAANCLFHIRIEMMGMCGLIRLTSTTPARRE